MIDLASGFINLEPARVDLAIEQCLRRIVEALDLDRSTLFQRAGDDLVVTHSWAVPGFDRFPRIWGRSELPWCFDQVMSGGTIRFSRIDDLPAEAAVDKVVVRRFGPVSNVTFPLRIGSDVFGALAFGSMRAERAWPDDVLDRLRTVANMIAGVLARRRTDDELRAALDEIRTLRDRLEHENRYLREQARGARDGTRIVGETAAIQHVLSLVAQVAPTNAPVLILGETGTGKELVAEAIHARSSRSDRTMVKVNCAALAPTLVESELFGRERGAYTGALSRQIGRFELADGSTLLLDEVSELPLELQAKLLRVLQSGEFERLGSPRTIRADVRLVAASNRDLAQAVDDGRFRADLYFRLAVIPIVVPPLRDRPDDIPLLARAIVNETAPKVGRRIESITDESLRRLRRYSWPGNIRELRNVVERAVILADGSNLDIEIPEPRRKTSSPSLKLEDIERGHILGVLEAAGWRVRGNNGAAAVLGLPPTTLEARMTKLGISRPS